MNYLLVLAMTVIAAFAGFCLKKSSGGFMSILKSPFFYAGGFLYLLSSLANIWLLKRMPYSVVLPMGGICYIWTLLLSRKFLAERITPSKIAGVALIIGGVALLSR